MDTSTAPGPNLLEIRRRLGTRAIGLDLADALERWRAEARGGDAEAFVQWILATQAEEQVMVTAVLPPRFATARVPTVSMDPTLILDPAAVVDATVIVPAALDPTLIGEATVITTPAAPDAPSGADATVVTDAPSATTTRVSPAPATPSFAPGAPHHPRYVILGEAGKGGMAVVHIARDLELIRKVALKRLAGSAAAHEDMQARFLREVQISAQLDHPNIAPVYGLEVGPDGVPAYAMKLVEGQTLEDVLKETRAFYQRDQVPDDAHALPTRLEHFLKVCDAIAYAHDKGVVHRDLKPANIMLGRHNEIYVMDWGICRVMRLPESEGQGIEGLEHGDDADADTRTRLGAIIGTARYMAPEQAQGRSDLIGPATDQYSLGLMLFELVTLQSPYEGRTVVDVLARAAKAELRPVSHKFPAGNVPVELAAIIGRATSAEPAQRYTNVRAFAADIRRYLRGDAVEARPDTTWQKAARYVAQHRQRVLTGVVALVAVSALGAAGLLYRHDRALTAAQARERVMAGLVDHVSAKGDLLQTRFLELQGEIDALASTAALALQHTSPSTAAFFWIDDFDVPARQPPDLVAVDGVTPPRSSTYGAWIPAAGVSRQVLIPQIRRLLHVRPYRNDLFQRARVLFGQTPDAAASGTATGVTGSGIEGFVLGLASGVTLQLPGHAGLPRGGHPSETPWYQLASGRAGAVWGTPYTDSASRGRMLLPVSQAIRADDGRELGVTGMLLSLDHVIRNLIGDAPGEGVRATLLLDAEGRVVASHGLPEQPLQVGGETALQTLADPALMEHLARQDTGYVATSVFGQPDVVAFDRIHPHGWVLLKVTSETVVEARAAAAP